MPPPTAGRRCCSVRSIAEEGKVYNAYLLAADGKLVARRLKVELPNYGTFDEKRVFESGPLPEPVEFRGVRFGIPICEDIWRESVCAHLKEAGAEFLLVPNGSPYELNKDEQRIALVEKRVTETGLAIAYLNRVGGQDELVFEGASFVINGDGELACHLPDFEEAVVTTEWKKGDARLALRPRAQEPDLDRFPRMSIGR